jgi:hypothetical protein
MLSATIKSIMNNVVMLSVIMLRVIMLRVNMLNVELLITIKWLVQGGQLY